MRTRWIAIAPTAAGFEQAARRALSRDARRSLAHAGRARADPTTSGVIDLSRRGRWTWNRALADAPRYHRALGLLESLLEDLEATAARSRGCTSSRERDGPRAGARRRRLPLRGRLSHRSAQPRSMQAVLRRRARLQGRDGRSAPGREQRKALAEAARCGGGGCSGDRLAGRAIAIRAAERDLAPASQAARATATGPRTCTPRRRRHFQIADERLATPPRLSARIADLPRPAADHARVPRPTASPPHRNDRVGFSVERATRRDELSTRGRSTASRRDRGRGRRSR